MAWIEQKQGARDPTEAKPREQRAGCVKAGQAGVPQFEPRGEPTPTASDALIQNQLSAGSLTQNTHE
jgi:hypothetical protein